MYKAKKSPGPREEFYILVRSGTDINSIPQKIRNEVGELLLFRKMTIRRGEKRIALDSDEAISNIEKEGYHVQDVRINMQIK